MHGICSRTVHRGIDIIMRVVCGWIADDYAVSCRCIS
jgi:hypothetical protein